MIIVTNRLHHQLAHQEVEHVLELKGGGMQ